MAHRRVNIQFRLGPLGIILVCATVAWVAYCLGCR